MDMTAETTIALTFVLGGIITFPIILIAFMLKEKREEDSRD